KRAGRERVAYTSHLPISFLYLSILFPSSFPFRIAYSTSNHFILFEIRASSSLSV
ncbi:hypothetical protein RYX36_018869, partial [Vicia faba]